MGGQQLNSLLRIARKMDDVLNNTSVILLFEAEGPMGTTRMLFSGDAQIENQEYAPKVADDKDENLAGPAQLDLYKVDHHGAATPRPTRSRPVAATGGGVAR
jgi:beta-lactamase superfamily II metal-dependent hydrolase